MIVCALLAAGANALATVLQRIGVEEATSTNGPQAVGRARQRLMASVLRRPIWFAGLGLMVASFLLQAIALALGNLTTVQPIMVTELLFLVVILGFFFHQTLGRREIITVVGTISGLAVFLAVSSAGGGFEQPDLDNWAFLLGAGVVVIVAAAMLGAHGSRSFRAACFGVAGGVAFALTAAFIKTSADQWSKGPFYVLSHWQAYAVAVAGLAGLVLSQHALEAGPVAASQSALLISNPLASIVMGVYLFGDHLDRSGGRLALELAALAVMFVSLFGLSHSPLIAAGGSGSEHLSEAKQDLRARSVPG